MSATTILSAASSRPVVAFQVKYLLRVFLRQYRDPAQAVEELNTVMSASGRVEDLVSLCALVIDTVGFNERGWIDLRGLPTTEQLHLTERISRPDFYTLRYEITIDDPGAYTAPWTSGLFFRLAPGAEQFEFVCQDGNLTSIIMTGEGNSHVDRTSRIVP